MRRLILLGAVFTVLTACGGRKVQVAAPSIPPSASAELDGLASYYAEPYHGRKTANGETFDTYNELTAAHRTLPFNTVVRVTNKANGREVEVRINDRGPFVDGRVIDLSLAAARRIDMVRDGITPVRLTVVNLGQAVQRETASGAVYAVQVGAFENPNSAESLRLSLEPRYKNVSVQPVENEKTLYRVRVGRESTLDSAEKLAAQLRKDDFMPFVVRLN